MIALIAVVTWGALFALGLFGQNVGLPSAVTDPAIIVALTALAFVIPCSALYGLLRDRPIGKSTSRQVWTAWRWRFAIGGAYAGALASALLLPSTRVSYQVRVGAVGGVIWALVCLWDAALAFQAKFQLQAPKDGGGAALWWGTRWTWVVLITVAVTVGWLLILVAFTNATRG